MAAHRFWQLFFDGSNSGNISSSHIEFHDAIGGPNVCMGGVGTASSTYSGFDANNVFAGTQMWASNGGAPQWIQYDFGPGNYHEIVEIAYQSRTDGYTDQTPNSGYMRYSDDGITWTTDGVSFPFGSQSTWSTGQVKTLAIMQPPPQSISKLGQYVVEGPVPVPQSVAKLAEYVVEGPPPIPQAVSKLGQYVVEGSGYSLFTSKLGLYIVEGPPSESKSLSQAMLGTF